MIFASPIWLLLLLPWGLLVWWLLRARSARVDVPFLQLWRGRLATRTTRRAWRLPPVPLGAMLLACLLAIIAAARPGLIFAAPDNPSPITIIVDRGATMSATNGPVPRYVEAADLVSAELLSRFGPGPITLISVPARGDQPLQTTRSAWLAHVRELPPTAASTLPMLRQAIEQQRHGTAAATAGPLLVITDQSLQIDDSRLIRISPPGRVRNAAIVQMAARQTPRPQLMLRLRNDSSPAIAQLRTRVDGALIDQRSVTLPLPGEHRDFFVDLPVVGRVVEASLDVEDDLIADNWSALVRQRRWPSIELRSPVPAPVARVIDRYRKLRPARSDSVGVAVLNDASQLPPDRPAVIVPAATEINEAEGELLVAPHPLTRYVDRWPRGGGAVPPEQWEPIVRRGDAVMVAVEPSRPRRVWVNLALERWSATADFVVFWTNVFNWAGEGGEDYVAQPIAALGTEWSPIVAAGQTQSSPTTTQPSSQSGGFAEPGLWPGLYQRTDGLLCAVNAGAIESPSLQATDWRPRLAQSAQRELSTRPQPIAAIAAIAAVLLTAVAALTWDRRPDPRLATPSGAS